MVIPAQFSGAEGFSEGLAAVRIGEKYGYIDKTGKLVIPLQFDDAGVFSVADEPEVPASPASTLSAPKAPAPYLRKPRP